MADITNPVTGQPRGATLRQPTKFDDQYQTSSLMYPDDLMQEVNNPYGGNYVVFYINVHEDSVLYKNDTNAYVPGDIPTRIRGEQAGSKYSESTITRLGGVAGAAAFSASNVAQTVTGMLGIPLKGGAATVVNAGAGFVVGEAVVGMIGKPGAEYKRQKKAIALYVPNDLNIGYSTRWEEASLAGSQAMAAVLENMSAAVSKPGLAAGGGTSTKDIVSKALEPVKGYVAGLAVQTPGVGQFISKSTGTAANPKKEQLFDRVDYRTFTFNYQFFPRSKEEAKKVQNIIYEFKLHMHPEFRPNTNQFLYIYPSEFDIYYYQDGKENMNLHRHTSCVLESMQVTYSPNGIFSTFEDGMPTQINVSMQFKELALLSKETIMDGF